MAVNISATTDFEVDNLLGNDANGGGCDPTLSGTDYTQGAGAKTIVFNGTTITATTSGASATITITGYTDRIGASAYNHKLSLRRADAVKEYLVTKGISADRLQVKGMGEENPVVTCDGVKKRAELIKCLEPNRRVEIEPVTFEKQ